jgi:hypothetical protein
LAVLEECTSQWESGTIRVRIAALKLANGNLDCLRMHIAKAQKDYRDILVAAEYPEYWKATCAGEKLTKKERQQLADADWEQYEGWLQR